MRGNTLVTGGSDGSVRVWSLEKMAPIHRLAAHDNSVTSLQFDDTRVVSGGSDGRVKVWDLKTGQLVRELTAPADAVWRVAFEEEKCVVMASRSNRTIMEVNTLFQVSSLLLIIQVWSFSPPEDVLFEPPTTTAQRNLLNAGGLPRPLSAVEYRSTGTQDQPMTGMSGLSVDDNAPTRGHATTRLGQIEYPADRITNLEDVEMLDPQPNTAPLPGTGPTFFHDD